MPADSRSSLPSSLHNAIGIFDSGVGGLSVLKAIRAALPQEDLVYVADSAHAPYGERSEDFITQRTLVLGEWLARQGVKAITIACNTATVVAAKRLRDSTQVPVIAIEPAIKPAAGLTRSGVIAVLATRQTVQSESVARLCELHGGGKKILLQACPGWVERVEAADLTSPHTLALLREVQTLWCWVAPITRFCGRLFKALRARACSSSTPLRPWRESWCGACPSSPTLR